MLQFFPLTLGGGNVRTDRVALMHARSKKDSRFVGFFEISVQFAQPKSTPLQANT
jgi:hypothetical protein